MDDGDKLRRKALYLKSKWGNINNEVADDIFTSIKTLKVLLFKLRLKLQFKKIRYYRKELKLLKQLELEVLNSRGINKEKGSHYL